MGNAVQDTKYCNDDKPQVYVCSNAMPCKSEMMKY